MMESKEIIAATIQADATVEAACIGALGLAIGILGSWLTALNLQKRARVADVRKGVYLELVTAYSNFIGNTYILLGDPLKVESEWRSSFFKLSGQVDRAAFVCKTDTKRRLFHFMEFLKREYDKIESDLIQLADLRNDLDQLQREHLSKIDREFYYQEIRKLALDDPQNPKIRNLIESWNNNLKSAEKIFEEIQKTEHNYLEKRKNCHQKLNCINEGLSREALKITLILRKEIGIGTDKKLDQHITEQFFKLSK